MEVSLSYNELASEIKKRTGREVVLEYVSWNKIKVSLMVKVMLLGSHSIGTTVEVAGFDGTTLKLESGTDMMLKIISMVTGPDITNFLSIEDSEIKVKLGKIDKLQKALDYVRPTNLRFDENNVFLDLEMV